MEIFKQMIMKKIVWMLWRGKSTKRKKRGIGKKQNVDRQNQIEEKGNYR